MDCIGKVTPILGVLLVGVAVFAFAWARRTAGSAEPSAPAAGSERRLGAYILGEPIGRGATSEVYRARHVLLGTSAAIKVLSSAFSAEDHERFEREARLMIPPLAPRRQRRSSSAWSASSAEAPPGSER